MCWQVLQFWGSIVPSVYKLKGWSPVLHAFRKSNTSEYFWRFLECSYMSWFLFITFCPETFSWNISHHPVTACPYPASINPKKTRRGVENKTEKISCPAFDKGLRLLCSLKKPIPPMKYTCRMIKKFYFLKCSALSYLSSIWFTYMNLRQSLGDIF